MSAATLADPRPQGVRIHESGVFANYFRAAGRGKHPAVILLGGAEGGLGTESMRDAKALQIQGFNALQLAYFDAPGTPKHLARVPLELFERGVEWLKARPEVDGERIGIEGASKGAEAALLFASRSRAIKAVVVGMPSSVVWEGMSFDGKRPVSSWSAEGRDFPFLLFLRGPNRRDIRAGFENGLKTLPKHPDAVIPAEKINGPVMLICGKEDKIWPSCPMSEHIVARLKAKHFRFPVYLLEYSDAGHGLVGPRISPSERVYSYLGAWGGSNAGNDNARADSWAREVALFDKVLKRAPK